MFAVIVTAQSPPIPGRLPATPEIRITIDHIIEVICIMAEVIQTLTLKFGTRKRPTRNWDENTITVSAGANDYWCRLCGLDCKKIFQIRRIRLLIACSEAHGARCEDYACENGRKSGRSMHARQKFHLLVRTQNKE